MKYEIMYYLDRLYEAWKRYREGKEEKIEVDTVWSEPARRSCEITVSFFGRIRKS